MIVCIDEPAAHEAARDVFAALRAELVVERAPEEFAGSPGYKVLDRVEESRQG